jgi:hypothetical protein
MKYIPVPFYTVHQYRRISPQGFSPVSKKPGGKEKICRQDHVAEPQADAVMRARAKSGRLSGAFLLKKWDDIRMVVI